MIYSNILNHKIPHKMGEVEMGIVSLVRYSTLYGMVVIKVLMPDSKHEIFMGLQSKYIKYYCI